MGKAAIEPAYNADTGNLMYLLTPINAPNPTKANAIHATSPLYIVVYPTSAASDVGTLNCEGLANCPDHAPEIAGFAGLMMPSVYGAGGAGVLGHDHIGDPPGGADFNVAWEVVVVLFTNKDAANTHLTTDTEIQSAITSGDAQPYDLGFAFTCSVVSQTVYDRGTPISG